MGIFNKAIAGGQRFMNKAVRNVGGAFSKNNIARITDKVENAIQKGERFGAKVVGGIERAVPRITRGVELFAPELAPELEVASNAVSKGLNWAKKGLERVGNAKLGVREIGNALLNKPSVLPPSQPDVLGV